MDQQRPHVEIKKNMPASHSIFLTVTIKDSGLSVTINSAYIVSYRYDQEKKVTSIWMANGSEIDVTQPPGVLDEALGCTDLQEPVFSQE